MKPQDLAPLITAALLSVGASQAGCLFGSPPCEDGTNLGWVPESSIEWGSVGVAGFSQEVTNCYYICAAYVHDYWASDTTACHTTGARREGEIQLSCDWEYCASAGRRPEGLTRLSKVRAPDGLRLTPRAMDPASERIRERLRQQAFLEAASVLAFGQLKGELRAHGAPRRLIRAAERAQVEERRHARVIGRLARQAGARLQTPRVTRALGPRSLRDIALENAVEGCVNETWGALLAAHQALRATDPGFRAASQAIAPDEARHASFSWALHRWLMPRLSPAERGEILSAQRSARAALTRRMDQDLDAAPLHALGIPSRDDARMLWGALEARLPLHG